MGIIPGPTTAPFTTAAVGAAAFASAGGPAQRSAAARFGDLIRMRDQTGATADAVRLDTGGAMTSGSAVLTNGNAVWTSADVGKSVYVTGAGSQILTSGTFATLTGTIASWQSATQVTLSVTAGNTVSNAAIGYGTNNATPLAAAIAAAIAKPACTLTLDGGEYFLASGSTIAAARRLRFFGEGGALHRGNGTILTVSGGCIDVTIEGLRFVGGYSGAQASTGSGDGVVIGGTGGSNGNNTEQGIRINQCKFSGFNHSCLLVNAASAALAATTPHNQDVWITNCEFRDASTGPFIYKNAKNIWVANCRMTSCGYNAATIDTCAASDNYRVSETIQDVHFVNNQADGCGGTSDSASTERTGMLIAKGDIRRIKIKGNICRDAPANANTSCNVRGLLVNQDGATAPSSGYAIEIEGNHIENVLYNGSNASGNKAWGLQVGADFVDVKIRGNSFKNVQGTHLFLDRVSTAIVSDNIFDTGINDTGPTTQLVRAEGASDGTNNIDVLTFARNHFSGTSYTTVLNFSRVTDLHFDGNYIASTGVPAAFSNVTRLHLAKNNNQSGSTYTYSSAPAVVAAGLAGTTARTAAVTCTPYTNTIQQTFSSLAGNITVTLSSTGAVAGLTMWSIVNNDGTSNVTVGSDTIGPGTRALYLWSGTAYNRIA